MDWPDATPMALVRAAWDRLLLTVSDCQTPMLRARTGHGQRGRSSLGPGSDGHELNRRARLALVTTRLVGKPSSRRCGSISVEHAERFKIG
jgi:hypothetical protein